MVTGPVDHPVMSVDGVLIVPLDLPRTAGGFRFGIVVDGTNEDGTPYVAPERGLIGDPAERERLLEYLRSGAAVVTSTEYDVDEYTGEPLSVPGGYRTDGTWIWPGAVAYYLEKHRVAPEPDFYRSIVDNGYRCPAVTGEVVERARRAVWERSDQVIRLAREADLRFGLAPVAPQGDRERFAEAVDDNLLAIGWSAGRDVSTEVRAWLDRAVPEHDPFWDSEGFYRYEPSPAALAVLDEFGGLRFHGGDRGVTSATVPFEFFPDGDLSYFFVKVQEHAVWLGRPLFQVGEIERGMFALAVADNGHVYAVGDRPIYFGRSIEDALTHMILGIVTPYPDDNA